MTWFLDDHTVIKILDGDTVVVKKDQSFKEIKIRFKCVDVS
jgi:hypothetical protein